ncbi:MAG TPA: phage tail protein [Gemmataceae bacterium]|nr:phage tail protein [Gemmataceae bacterium]
MLSDRQHWRLREGAAYDDGRRSVRLTGARTLPPWEDTEAQARGSLEITPQAIDALGTRAVWDATAGQVVPVGELSGQGFWYAPPAGESVTDLLTTDAGVLYVAVGGRVELIDLRGRWDRVELEATGFVAWRLAPHPDGGVWVLDRTNRKLARVAGRPLPRRPFAVEPVVFRSCEENPDPPRLVLGPVTPLGAEPVALAASPGGRLALLTWTDDGKACVQRLTDDGMWEPPLEIADGHYPFSLAWVTGDRVAVLGAGLNEALVFALEAKTARLVGDRHPLRDHDGGPFLHSELPPRYPTPGGANPLHPLSLPSFARHGLAENELVFDAGEPRTAWHRLYLEAVFPPHCGATVELAATDERARPCGDWHPHLFGAAKSAGKDVPRGVWLRQASELAFHPGLLCCPPAADRAGLFTVLIQRPGRRVRTLTGRYLWVRVRLHGDGRSTPEVAAVRAYAPRFSYLNRYLPELYREQLFGADADAEGDCTPADFLERFLDVFEGVLTPLEDRVAAAYRVTDPATAPDEALAWLGGWVGLAFDPAYPPDRRRTLLRRTPELYRRRGTVRGLQLALDIATGGAVARGQVVVVEEFRLRRTLATILGADLADETDPLTGAFAVSGNSFVGDTLFLGDETRREFLALFGPSAADQADEQAIAAFYDELAFRVAVLVDQQIDPQDLGLLRRVVDRETPAHVLARVVAATEPFLVGIAALVGVDSYIGRDDPPRPFEVDGSRLGGGDVLGHDPGLDPRREAVRAIGDPPQAALRADGPVNAGDAIRLDGSGSTAAPGRRLVRYVWRRDG